MDVLLLARIQFALTIGFHFLFPPITIGLAWLLVVLEGMAWRKQDAELEQIAKFFAKLLALTFVVGVATGIVMEFQFGTNWARYSAFVGDVFGAPLAAEGVFAFFLESGFLGLYLFGRNRVSRRTHWIAIVMVAVGATISAFWILVANSWQQTPAGFAFRNGRAELLSFREAVFNESMWPRFFHTLDAALIAGCFFVAGISAYLLLKNKGGNGAKQALRLAVLVGFVAALVEVFPSGHVHAQQVARTQPEKFAAIEGLYTSQEGAPLVFFALPTAPPPRLAAKLEVPKLLSYMAFGDFNARIPGIDEFPADRVPPLWLTFVSFHNMVVLGMFFIALMGWSALRLRQGRLWTDRRLLWALVLAIPLPLAAIQLGWITAEVGRQPWIVYGLMRTAEAHSAAVSHAEVQVSLIMFSFIYLLLGSLYVYLLVRDVRRGPVPLPAPAHV